MSRADGLSPQHIELAKKLGIGREVTKLRTGRRMGVYTCWDLTDAERRQLLDAWSKHHAKTVMERSRRREARRDGKMPRAPQAERIEPRALSAETREQLARERAARIVAEEGILTFAEALEREREAIGLPCTPVRLAPEDVDRRRMAPAWRAARLAEITESRRVELPGPDSGGCVVTGCRRRP